MSLPKGIQFKTVKPQGFYQEYRDYFVTPVQTYTNQFSVYDIVRIQFNIQGWFIDPYESYIEAEVRLADETPLNMNGGQDFINQVPVQFLMMDGPSTSLINDFRFEVNSKEIERIREYDQIGNLLTDLCLYPDAVDQKDYEGYYSIKGNKTIFQSEKQSSNTTFTYQSTATSNIIASSSGDNLPIISSNPYSYAVVNGDIYPTNSYGTYSALITNVPLSSLPIQVGQVRSNTSAASFSNASTTAAVLTSTSQIDFNVAASPQNFIAPDTFLSGLTIGNTNYGICDADKTISTTSRSYLPCQQSPKLSQIDGHNIFLTNLPVSKITNGQYQDYICQNSAQTQNSRQYMQIPLLSGVMGVLIPSERWQLIPSDSLGQVNMEFRFNPNAFFSHDGSQPKWMVNKFQLRLRMYRFDDQLMRQLKSQLDGGIQLHSQIFSMGPLYNIQPNTSITNNWQLNNGIPSIKQIFFWFLSNDYETKWHCRKNFKLSQNVTSMQLKIGSTYLPQNPIIGHAGNIVMNQQIQQDNSVYLSELHQALNVLFDCKRHININKLNFAINDRPYDTSLNTIFGTDVSAVSKAQAKAYFLKMGYPLWNELRCRGKAVYAFNLEMDKKNDDTMTGIDTTKVRPIELILKNDDGNYFQRQSTMYVMFLSDFIVTFRNGETVTEGAG